MTFTTTDNTSFQLPALDRAQIEAASPRTLVAELFQANPTTPWQRFSPNNVKQIVCHIAEQHQLLISEAPSAIPFVIIGKPSSTRAREISYEWRLLGSFLRQNLPAVPSPKLISTNPAERLAFNFRGNRYILPELRNPSLFKKIGRQGFEFEIGVFVKKFLADNKGVGCKIINDKILDEALKEFAVQGFPGSSKRFKSTYRRWSSECDCFIELNFRKRPAEGQRSEEPVPTSRNGILELLNGNTDQSTRKADGQSSTEPFLIHYEIGAQEEVYIATSLSSQIRHSSQILRHSQTALSSENCALSIALSTRKNQQANPAQVFEQVIFLRTKGLANAFLQHDRKTIVLAYDNSHHRDNAYQTLSRPETVSGIERVEKMCPATPRRYITWAFQAAYHITAGELLDALNSYFWGSGFSSRCVISWTGDRDAKYFITFERTPPFFGRTLARPNRSVVAVFEVNQSISIAPPEAIGQIIVDTRNTTSTIIQEDSSNNSGQDSDASDEEDDEQQNENSSEASDEQGDQRSSSDANDDEDLESSSEGEAEHDNGIPVPAISRVSSNAAAIDASKSKKIMKTKILKKTKTKKKMKMKMKKKKKMKMKMKEKQQEMEEKEKEKEKKKEKEKNKMKMKKTKKKEKKIKKYTKILSPNTPAATHQPTQASSPNHNLTLPQAPKRVVSSPVISKRPLARNASEPPAHPPHPLTSAPTSSQPVPLAPTHLNPPKSISAPKDPKQPSYPIRPPSKIARLATKDEEEEDPLALLERYVDEYALRLKRESAS
ncbi:hypothetical protein G7Y79_00011g031250 [Physcia stellaris]|nr:hypothetical protein G7Y79_00011g031250 [Physcia stellaris]